MTTPVLLLVAILAGAAALWLLEASIRRSAVGAAVLTIYIVAVSADVPLPNVMVGSIAVNVGDLVFALIATATVARLLRSRRLEAVHYWLLAFGAIVIFSLVRGMPLFGPAAVNEARSWLLPTAAMIYIATAVR